MLHSASKTLCALAGLCCLLAANPLVRADSAVIGQPAPAWELTDLDGNIVRSTNFPGKVVLLNFFRTTCTPCLWEIPDLVSLQEQYGSDGLVIIGIGAQQSADVLRPYAAEQKIDYVVCPSLDSMLWDYNIFPVGAIPCTAVIDRNGVLADWYRFYQPRVYHEEIIRPLLASGNPPLTLLRSGTDLALTWPTNAESFVVETTADWASLSGWQTLTNTVALSNGMHRVRLDRGKGIGFFRLRRIIP